MDKKEAQYVPSEDTDITLEHILPESPQKGWEHISAEDKLAHSHRLGNLVLLQATRNSSLGNLPYSEKKSELLKSEFSLTREAGEFGQWGPTEITERQKRLAELAVKAWPLRSK